MNASKDGLVTGIDQAGLIGSADEAGPTIGGHRGVVTYDGSRLVEEDSYQQGT